MVMNSRLLFAAAALISVTEARAADWPQFLGPARNGVAAADEQPVPGEFKSEPKVVWEKTLGSGHAGPAVAGGRVVVFHREGGNSVVEALEPGMGNALWRTVFPTSYRDSFGMDDGPRATPAVSDGRVFIHGADGVLTAIALADGQQLWQVDTVKTFDSPQGFFGRACAPLVHDGRVIITPGGAGGKAVAAFDVKDGSLKWAAGDDEASYSSPVVTSPTVLTCWLRNHLTTLDLLSGKVLSREHFRPEIEASVSAATPVKTDHGWFVTAEYDVGSSLWDIGGDGSLKKTWSSDAGINAHYATPVYFDGHLYGFDGRQESGQTLRCWDTATHQSKWDSPRVKGGTLLLVKDKLLVVTESGELWVVPATPAKFDPITTVQIMRAGHRGYAAYSNGVLYARDAEKLVAVKLVP